MIKRTALVLALLVSFMGSSFAGENNDLRTKFLNNQANILGINIRTFNAQDTNGNEIIDENEVSGNFINAIERLDEIKELGINTIHVLPITPVGKLKALGTAGSLYAISGFDKINEQLVDKTSNLSPKDQAKKFIDECHKRGIKVVIDLPSCGSYDLFLKRPELFIKDDKNISIVPTDWTDVRLLNAGNNDKLNQDVLDEHKKFIEHIKFNNKLLKSYNEPKSVIMSFTTHDEVSPVILHGANFSVMISWLEAVLPYNPYSIDGFPYGDEYIYPWANGKAKYTQTDDETYFVHRGKLDIFNFSRTPKGGQKGINEQVLNNFKNAYKFRDENIDLITKGEFTPLKTDDEKIFAFMISSKEKHPERIIVLGNLDFKNTKDDICVKLPRLHKDDFIELVQGDGSMQIHKRKLTTSLTPGEIEIAKISK